MSSRERERERERKRKIEKDRERERERERKRKVRFYRTPPINAPDCNDYLRRNRNTDRTGIIEETADSHRAFIRSVFTIYQERN